MPGRPRRPFRCRATTCGALFGFILVPLAELAPDRTSDDGTRAAVIALVEQTLNVVRDVEQRLAAGGVSALSRQEADSAQRLLRRLRRAVELSEARYRAGLYDRALGWARAALDLARRLERSIESDQAAIPTPSPIENRMSRSCFSDPYARSCGQWALRAG